MERAERTPIRNCNVCVIGGAGFLGSHLVDYLIEERGCRVTVLDNLVSGQQKHIHEKATFFKVDITSSFMMLQSYFSREKYEYIFNYAAEPYVPGCYERPAHYFNVNAASVLTLLNIVQDCQWIKGFLQVSSAEIYGDMEGKIKESDYVQPHSTYGVSKMAADALVQVRWREAKVPAIAMRQFNCVGERETHEYVIPEIISQIHANGPRINLGNNSNRDFQYAGDAVRMAVELLEKGEFGEVYNMGSEDFISIYNLAGMISDLMGYPIPQIVTDPERRRAWEIWHLQSDNSKLYSVIESRPEVSLEDALRRTINYFYNNGNRWDW